MDYKKVKKARLFLILILVVSFNARSQSPCSWNPEKKEMEFSLSDISGVLNCDMQQNPGPGKSHHFSNVIYKPTGMMISPDGERMAGAGMLNFFRVLIEGGYLTELRVEEAELEPGEDGISLTWMPTIRRQAKVKVKFTFKEPNIIDMDMWVETLSNYPGFEILLSAYLAPGFESGVYVATEEFGPVVPEQIRLIDQPMIHRIWPFFPRNEAGANLLTDGRHQKGRFFWRMAIGRRYGMPLAFFSKNGVDALLMGRPEDVYAVGATYKGDEVNDNVAGHRSLYLSVFGEDFKAGEGRYTQMRMIIGDYGSDPEKHKELYQSFLKDVESTPRSFTIYPL
ncbi:MAG: hypothetical protein K9H49_06485 [Bacteroidales bacterium]|nr:hypothetical protein [Bacteroidales bacterium]MCF8389320.1 hypothetical protein [Bacteroidales bacterium]